jgi:tyrosine-protein phosphatase YwqE
MFENTAQDLRRAYANTGEARAATSALPQTSLGSEHFFDADVISRIQNGQGLPYSGQDPSHEIERTGGAILVEFSDFTAIALIEKQLFQLQTRGYIPVIAHPERYRAVWSDHELISRLVELGSVALLDVSALVGKYGSRAQSAAETLLENGIYDAACTDSHRPADVDMAEKAMARVEKMYGSDELELLFGENARRLLLGQRPVAA